MGALVLPREQLLPVRGSVEIQLGGQIVWRDHNLFTSVGYARLASFLAGLTPAAPAAIAVGNGDGTAAGATVAIAQGDTAMSFELLRRALTSQSVQSSYTARLATVFLAADTQRRLTEIGLWDASGDNGTATGAGQSTTALVDTSKTWTVNQWAGWTLYVTNAADGDAVKKAIITSNTATALTLTSALTTAPVAGTTTYTIGGGSASNVLFAHASVSVPKGNQPMLVLWQLALPLS